MDRLVAVSLVAVLAAASPLQLHLGCNTVDFGPDWVHIDAAHHPHVSSHNVKELPFADGSASIVYSSHMFEYFDRDEAKEVLAVANVAPRDGDTSVASDRAFLNSVYPPK